MARWVAGLLLLCLLAQALLLPAQRTNERLHFHIGSAAVSPVIDTPPAPPTFARAVFAHRKAPGHDEDARHRHATLEDHEHRALSGVVYVGDDAGPSSSGQGGSKRSLLDQDGLNVRFAPWLMRTEARVGFIKSSLRLHTRNELPLERPPRSQL